MTSPSQWYTLCSPQSLICICEWKKWRKKNNWRPSKWQSKAPNWPLPNSQFNVIIHLAAIRIWAVVCFAVRMATCCTLCMPSRMGTACRAHKRIPNQMLLDGCCWPAFNCVPSYAVWMLFTAKVDVIPDVIGWRYERWAWVPYRDRLGF